MSFKNPCSARMGFFYVPIPHSCIKRHILLNFQHLPLLTISYMRFYRLTRLPILFLSCLLVSCSSTKKAIRVQPVSTMNSIRLLGQYDIPYGLSFKNTTVGGLSGIDYDSKNGLYYLICDDRSAINPARFYTAKIFVSQSGIDSIVFVSVNYLLQQDGTTFPNNKKDPQHTPDPEAIRFNPVSNTLVWSNEGERIVKDKQVVLSNPTVHIIDTTGKYTGHFQIPANLYMNPGIKGPRQNSVLEGMSFADNYASLFVNVEEPLYDDGPRADTTNSNAYIRIMKFDVKTGINTKQYAYPLDPVAYRPDPPDAYMINGVPDILFMGDDKLLVIERSFSTGRLACAVKLYIADLSEATDISKVPSLQSGILFNAARKKLLFNMDETGRYIDNVEGICFGPVLPNGKKSLLLVADNNFNPIQKSQVFLFEINE